MATLFSKIISGMLPCYKIFEDQHTFAFLTLDAVHLGHSLIIPKIEVDHFFDVPDPYYAKVFENSKFLAKAIHRATQCERVGAIIAGWEVPHFHLHLIPMFGQEDLDLKKTKIFTQEENQKIQIEIAGEIARELTRELN